ncbi:MAG TPA: hypothetical protein VE988_30725 [Gemmataceae bacterium]|nr:hypothetical protein [Gemmataceae bacterium]
MQPIPFSTADVHAPSSNTAAVVTYAAVSDRRHVISGVAWSYSAAPTGGQLTIEDGSGNTVFQIDITAAGPGVVYFTPPKNGTLNTALIATLAAGGSSVSGKISIVGHWKE